MLDLKPFFSFHFYYEGVLFFSNIVNYLPDARIVRQEGKYADKVRQINVPNLVGVGNHRFYVVPAICSLLCSSLRLTCRISADPIHGRDRSIRACHSYVLSLGHVCIYRSNYQNRLRWFATTGW